MGTAIKASYTYSDWTSTPKVRVLIAWYRAANVIPGATTGIAWDNDQRTLTNLFNHSSNSGDG